MAYDWHSVRVGGGGFAPGVVFSPVEPGLAWLRTDMGGAYRWDAKAGRWLALQDGVSEGSYMGIESLAADPVDPGTVYLAAGMHWSLPSAIFRSTDYGRTWRVTPVPFRMGGNENGRGLGERLAIDPFDHDRLFFGSRHQGLWTSADAGATWHKAASFPLAGLGVPTDPRATHGGLSFVVFDPQVKGRLFVGSADPGTPPLLRSDDGGQTWHAVPGAPDDGLLPVKAAIGSDSVLTVAWCDGIGPNGITRGAVWRFDPARGAWRDVTPLKGKDAPAGGYMGVSVAASDPKTIAVSTVDRGYPVDTVWLSHDGGAHWDALYKRSVRDVSATPFLDFDGKANFGHWIAGLAIDPFDADHAAYVTGATVYATHELEQPGTLHWAPWTRGIEQTAIITLTSPTGGAHLVSGFGDIAGFRHGDLKVSPPHMHLNPFLSNTNTLDYAGRAPRMMVRSGSVHARVVPDTSLAWSADGGNSWTPLHVPAGTPHADGSPLPEQTGDAAITVSADGRTFLAETDVPRFTRDRGAHWQVAKGLPSRVRVTADKVDARRFYAIDFAKGRIVRSDDGGAHFHAVAGKGLPADLSAAHFTNREAPAPLLAEPGRAGALWLNLGGGLWHSVDFGKSWARTGETISVERYGLGKAAPGRREPALYALGAINGLRAIWRSDDGGESWVRINDDAHQWGMRIRVISGDPRRFGRVYIGTDGRGIVYGDPVNTPVKGEE
ncbi:WD40/YVTN/BNR-like repeat-containing protein [Novosphingobium beihaiensis]|uniref:BNR/Asp-box repeat protein n=1 Tax=Novosphingobium beihaiensis TaxID=2930389 RepID=A0ABT0BQ91_9SPHN|nr:hypothetical protein [Novosphingobium beihaiensis]MCJ2187212.1 hypothetical protein [Novosphingobium beihaiensis]